MMFLAGYFTGVIVTFLAAILIESKS